MLLCQHLHHFVLLFIVFCTKFHRALAVCDICGSFGGGSITNLDAPINLPQYPFLTNCGSLISFLPLLPDDSKECHLISSIGTYCGCTVPENACHLCLFPGDTTSDNDHDRQSSSKQLDDQQFKNQTTKDHNLIQHPQRKLPFLASLFDGIIPTCAMAQAYLHAWNKNDDMCILSRVILSYHCGCPNANMSTVEFLSASDDMGSTNNTNGTRTTTTPPLCTFCDSSTNTRDDATIIQSSNATTLSNNNSLIRRHQRISIPGIPFTTCGQLEEAVQTVFYEGTYECKLMQRISAPLCGCASNAATKPCNICRDTPDDAMVHKRRVHFARDIFFGVSPDCNMVRDYTASFEADDDFCPLAQRVGSYCGCPARPNSCRYCPHSNPDRKNNNNNMTVIPETIVLDKQFVPIELRFTNPQILQPSLLDPKHRIDPTCEMIESTQYQIHEDDGQCMDGKLTAHLCGCRDGEFLYLGATSTEQLDILAWLCRISGFLSIMGALAIQCDILLWKRQRAFRRLLGASGSRSLSAARNQRHTNTVYSRLILMVSMFDLATGIGVMLGTSPQPIEDRLGIPLNYPGSRGTIGTCKLQGFTIALGTTSIWYSVILATYYRLTIVDGWRELRLRRNEYWLHGLPLVLGVGSALCGIPFYDISPFGCFLIPYPLKKTLPWILPLIYFPVLSGILYVTSTMIYVYRSLQKQLGKSKKWRFPKATDVKKWGKQEQNTGEATQEQNTRFAPRNSHVTRTTNNNAAATQIVDERNRLLNQVFWQAFSYASSYIISWPTFMLGYLLFERWVLSSFWFWAIFSILSPLQGFSNAVVYYRPRISKWLERQRSRKESSSIPSFVSGRPLSSSGNDAISLSPESIFSADRTVLPDAELYLNEPSSYIALVGLAGNTNEQQELPTLLNVAFNTRRSGRSYRHQSSGASVKSLASLNMTWEQIYGGGSENSNKKMVLKSFETSYCASSSDDDEECSSLVRR